MNRTNGQDGNTSKVSSSGVSSNSSSSNGSTQTVSDIFYLSNPNESSDSKKKQQQQSTDENQLNYLQLKYCNLSSSEMLNYNKHNNLDAYSPSICQLFNLERIRFLTISNGIRLALIIICFGWFMFNAYIIFDEYIDYSTVVLMEYRSPSKTGPPAISICTHCILCGYNKTILRKLAVIDTLRFGDNTTPTTYHIGNNISEELGDVDISCQFYSTSVLGLRNELFLANCTDAVPIVISMQEGQKCFTFFSNIHGEMSRIFEQKNNSWNMEFQKFPTIQLRISGKLLSYPFWNDDWTSEFSNNSNKNDVNKVSPGLFVTVHDPTQLSYMQGIPLYRIQPGKDIDLRFQKKVEILKEYPYSTNCYNYETSLILNPEIIDERVLTSRSGWTPFGKAIYRSQGECFLYCIWRRVNTDRCVNIYSIFTTDQIFAAEFKVDQMILHGRLPQNPNFLNDMGKIRYCKNNNDSINDYLRNKEYCLIYCNRACRVNSFFMDPNILDYEGLDPNITTINIQWAPKPYTYISHREKLDLNEFLEKNSNITTLENEESKDTCERPYIIFEPSDSRRKYSLTLSHELQLANLTKTSNEPIRSNKRGICFFLGKVIRSVIVFLCLTWFMFNFFTVLNEYLDYSTIIYLNYETPNTSSPPAVTLCTHCILCGKNDSIQKMEVEKVFKTDYIENLFNQQLNASKQRNKEVGNNNNKDIDISCILSLNSVQSVKKEWINCTDIVPMVLSMQEGHKCYTFFSDIDKQMSKAIENNPQYLLKFDLQPMIKINIVGKYVNESHYNSGLDQNPANKMKPKVGVYIAVHDATILPDMIDINFRRLYLNEYLWIPFAKRIQQLQPPPYKTKCYQYADWSTSNNELSVIKNIKQNKYKSRGECFIYCMWRDLNHNRCANFYSIYTEQIMIKDSLLRNNSIKFCSDSNQSYEKYIKTKNLCLNQCPQGCHQETFFTQDTMAEKDVMSIFGNLGTTVAIPWSIQAIEYINHQPKWEFEELLGTLGGHVHIWLGVSVIQIIWFIIRLFEIQNYRLTAICINLRITNWGPLGAPTHAFLP